MAVTAPARKALKRLLVPSETIVDGRALLEGPDRHYVVDVLRFEAGTTLELSDGEGGLYQATIERITKRRVELELGERRDLPPPPAPRLVLLDGIARGGRTEHVLQKSTELGVDRLCPLICRRSVSRPKEVSTKHQRYSEVIRQAARQSHRSWLPRLDMAEKLEDALPHWASSPSTRLVATLNGPPLSQKRAQIEAEEHEIVLLVGPEGGLCDEEIDLALNSGFEPVGLGPQVLRTETAATALLAIVAFIAGRLDR